jgi:2',3'-cyclic-nucleotide 2'-phosphodiesterase (5'-nucleotidase family)
MGYVKPSILRLILTVFLSAGLFAQDQTLYILHTNNTNGALENCYCPDHPFGSVEKRTIFVKDFINEHPNTVLVDAGDFFTMTHQSYKDSHGKKIARIHQNRIGVFVDEILHKNSPFFDRTKRMIRAITIF